MKWIVVALAIVIAIAAVAYKVAFPSYSYRYRLQLTLEIGGKMHTGSSVIEVTWGCSPRRADSGCSAKVAGQGTAIDLGTRGVLVATLHTGDHILPVPDGAADAIFLCATAFGNHSTWEELPLLPHLMGRRSLSEANFPRLVWFPDPADLRSGRKVTLRNIGNAIDPTARFAEASVEITGDPIVIDIANKLPWYPALKLEQKGKAIPTMPDQFHIFYNMLVGENS